MAEIIDVTDGEYVIPNVVEIVNPDGSVSVIGYPSSGGKAATEESVSQKSPPRPDPNAPLFPIDE